MTFEIREAKRESVQLLIGLAGGTGSGKTYTAMRLAAGIAAQLGGRPVMIDTEAGRGKHYADFWQYDHVDFPPPFSPERYTEAIEMVDKTRPPVIVLDSMSHEWAGDGGVLDMQEAEYERMGFRESAKVASWIKPKIAHKRMVTKLLQVRSHIVLCFRAEPKIEVAKDEKGKTVIIPKESLIGYKGWIPVTEKNLPFELTVSFMLTADRPGMPHPIKLQEQHKPLFPLDTELTEQSGRDLALWAAGGLPEPRDDGERAMLAAIQAAAMEGQNELRAAWQKMPEATRTYFRPRLANLRRAAAEADAKTAA